MTRLLHSLLIVLVGSLISCGGSSALTKKATKLDEAGLSTEAAAMYYDAQVKKPTNTDAKIGLKKTGQILLSQKLATFTKTLNFGTKKEAVYSYLEADSYRKKVENVGVHLDMPEMYEADFQLVKDQYLTELYSEGMLLLDEQKFNNAENVFHEISELDPSFKDANDLKEIAYVEPLYRDGVNALEAGKYRTALTQLNKVDKRRTGYKQTTSLKAQAIEEGRFSMALMSFENSTNRAGLEAMIEAYVLEALSSIDDPFLRIVDRENMNAIIEEQTLGMTGVIDEETAVSVGELIGAQALVTGTVLSYSAKEGRTIANKKTGYEQYKVKRYNKEQDRHYMENKYRKKEYTEFQKTNTASISFQYKVISLSTGEVLFTKMITKDGEDKTHYAKYDGEDVKSLFPAGTNGKVNTSASAQNRLHRLVDAPREVKTAEEITSDLLEDASYEVKGQIRNLLKREIR